MSTGGIPKHVERFIVDYIDSVELLEVLLLLQRTAPAVWDSDTVARELRIAPESARMRLETLRSQRLLEPVDGAAPSFRYAPDSVDLDRGVRGLAETYAARRVSVITLIFSKPDDSIRSFADAFRIRKD
jgi:hypothetical protein